MIKNQEAIYLEISQIYCRNFYYQSLLEIFAKSPFGSMSNNCPPAYFYFQTASKKF